MFLNRFLNIWYIFQCFFDTVVGTYLAEPVSLIPKVFFQNSEQVNEEKLTGELASQSSTQKYRHNLAVKRLTTLCGHLCLQIAQ